MPTKKSLGTFGFRWAALTLGISDYFKALVEGFCTGYLFACYLPSEAVLCRVDLRAQFATGFQTEFQAGEGKVQKDLNFLDGRLLRLCSVGSGNLLAI